MKKLLVGLLLLSFTALSTPSDLIFKIEETQYEGNIKAFIGDKEAGYINFRKDSAQEAYISALLVYENFRKSGIGTGLMQKAVGFFKENHYTTIRLYASPWDSGPRLTREQLYTFYGKFGFYKDISGYMVHYFNPSIQQRIEKNIWQVRETIKKHPYITAFSIGAILGCSTKFMREKLSN